MEEERTVNERPVPEKSPEPGFSYFEIQAHWGVTKHMGGLKATEELAELVEYVDRIMANARFLTAGGWKELLVGTRMCFKLLTVISSFGIMVSLPYSNDTISHMELRVPFRESLCSRRVTRCPPYVMSQNEPVSPPSPSPG
jgi:hypothetical protein